MLNTDTAERDYLAHASAVDARKQRARLYNIGIDPRDPDRVGDDEEESEMEAMA